MQRPDEDALLGGDNLRTMPEDDIALVRQAMNTIVENDFEGWFALASTEIKVYPRAEEPGVRPCYEGWGEMLEYLVNWYSGWAEYTVAPERFIDAGEWVVVDLREVGLAEQSGVRVDQNFAHALRVEDGEIVEWRTYGPVDEALAAVGA
jgi:ketosteroid isomerase-like protein